MIRYQQTHEHAFLLSSEAFTMFYKKYMFLEVNCSRRRSSSQAPQKILRLRFLYST